MTEQRNIHFNEILFRIFQDISGKLDFENVGEVSYDEFLHVLKIHMICRGCSGFLLTWRLSTLLNRARVTAKDFVRTEELCIEA